MRIQRIEQSNIKKQQSFGTINIKPVVRDAIRTLSTESTPIPSNMGSILEAGIAKLEKIDALFVNSRNIDLTKASGQNGVQLSAMASPSQWEVNVALTPAIVTKLQEGYCFLRARVGGVKYWGDNHNIATSAGGRDSIVNFTPVTNSLIKINGEPASHPSIDRLLNEARCHDPAVRTVTEDNILRLTSLDKVLGNGEETQIRPINKINSDSYVVLSRVTNEHGAISEVALALNHPETLGARFEDAYCFLRAKSIDYYGHLSLNSVTVK